MESGIKEIPISVSSDLPLNLYSKQDFFGEGKCLKVLKERFSEDDGGDTPGSFFHAHLWSLGSKIPVCINLGLPLNPSIPKEIFFGRGMKSKSPQRRGLVRMMQLALKVEVFSVLIHGVWDKTPSFSQLRAVWPGCVSLPSPGCVCSSSREIPGQGWSPWGELWDPQPCQPLGGFALSSFPGI